MQRIIMAIINTPAAASPAMTPASKEDDDESLESDFLESEEGGECLERDLGVAGTFPGEFDSSESGDGGENIDTGREPLEEGVTGAGEEPDGGNSFPGGAGVSSVGGEGGEDSTGGGETGGD